MIWLHSEASWRMSLGFVVTRVLKDIWSSFCDRGWGAGTLVSRRIKMLRHVNERLFLYFEVPRWNGNSRSNLCNAQKLADEVRAYFADEELW